MFSHTKKMLLSALAAVALLGTTGTVAQAQGFRGTWDRDIRWTSNHSYCSSRHETVDRLAGRLEREARLLNREVDSHFRGCPDYRVFENMVDDIVRLADHVHNVAHRGGNLWHLRSDLEKLDRLYHGAERLFDRMVAFRRLDRETVVHVRRAMNAVERTVHDLRDVIN